MPKKAKIREEEKSRFKEMRSQGLTVLQIMERTGKSMSTVYKFLKEPKAVNKE